MTDTVRLLRHVLDRRYIPERSISHETRQRELAVWRVIEHTLVELTDHSLESEHFPSALIKLVPAASAHEIERLSEYLWMDWRTEKQVRAIIRCLKRDGLRFGPRYWSMLDQTLHQKRLTFWHLAPYILVIRTEWARVLKTHPRHSYRQSLNRLLASRDLPFWKDFLRSLARVDRLESEAIATPPPVVPGGESAQAIMPDPAYQPDPTVATTLTDHSEPTVVLASSEHPDPVLGWIVRMNGSRFDHLLDRIHVLADAWRQDQVPRDSLLEPMAAVVLNLEKFLKASGVRPRYPVGKSLRLTLEESADFDYQGAAFTGEAKQVQVTRPGWHLDGVAISRPTVVETTGAVLTP